ncbi:MAG: hypothetical protein P9M08_07810 [Candidatus Erginobacter occultus]|nr:hypothetical protein [Candidatus Erginobacter occultus]
MKKILVLLLISAALAGNLYCAPDAETLRAALPEGYGLISVDPESSPLTGKVRAPEGQVLTAYLIKGPTGEWVASSNPQYFRPLDDVFVRSEQKDESGIEVIQEREQAREAEERQDQNIADDVVDDLR